MFAYYQGKISYQALIEALLWQRRQRPMLGTIATQWGWLNETQVKRIVRHLGQSRRFGKKAMDLGLLSPLQVDSLLRYQQGRQERLGQYFITQGLMSAEEAEGLARDLKIHNQKFLAQNRRHRAAAR